MSPTKIGPYKIESLLEKGGTSLLYLATHPETKDPLTIKVLLPKYLSRQDIVRRFLKEAEILSLANHPNIVKLYGHAEWEGGRYIAMEFVQGVSLRHFIQHAPLSLKRAVLVILEIAYALCHLHAHGVIHCDLKPDNILMTETGIVKIIDFGIAQLIHEQQIKGDKQQQQYFIGTPFYMSPEQKQYSQPLTYATDIYSLGIIAYELFLGKLSHGQLHLALIPKGLQKILTKALQTNLQERYSDIVDFISDLSAYLNSELLEKEKKDDAHLGEISEQLRQLQSQLFSRQLPSWPSLEVALSSYRGFDLSGAYCDFFALCENKYAIVLAETESKGIAAIAFIAALRGIVRALIHSVSAPAELASRVNAMLVADPIRQPCRFSYLLLTPEESLLEYLSCGYGHLWSFPQGLKKPLHKIVAENIALGIESQAHFSATRYHWSEEELLLLYSFASGSAHPTDKSMTAESLIQETLLENGHLPLQKQADILFRKLKRQFVPNSEEKPAFLFLSQNFYK